MTNDEWGPIWRRGLPRARPGQARSPEWGIRHWTFVIALLLTCSCPLLAGPTTRADISVLELADGRTVRGVVVATSQGKVTIQADGGLPPQELPLAALARLTCLPFAPTGRPADGISLACGDIVEGAPISLEAGLPSVKKLKVDSVRFGPIEVDIKTVRGIFFDRAMDTVTPSGPASPLRLPPNGQPKAEAILNSGSRTAADLRWIDARRIGLYSPLGPLEINRSDVAWVLLAPPKAPTVAAGAVADPGQRVRLNLTTGESLTCQLRELTRGQAKIFWNNLELRLPWDLVRSVESAGEHLAYLSSLAPSKVELTSTVGAARPPVMDGSACPGYPMRLARGRADGQAGPRTPAADSIEHGVGMRATSQVTWSLDGQWQRLRATVGLDEQARASRGVTFEVQADGKKVFAKAIRPGDGPADVDVSLAGVKELVLALDDERGLDIGDYGDWADARLIR